MTRADPAAREVAAACVLLLQRAELLRAPETARAN
jgi:hypothetical protein